MSFLEVLSTNAPLLIVTSGVFGLLVGSFLNVVIYRLPVMLEREWKSQCRQLLAEDADNSFDPTSEETFNLVKPDSRCQHCAAAIKPWQNIPVVSFLLLRGKCASCGASISKRYPIIELVSGLLSAFIAYYFGFSLEMMSMLLLTWMLIALTMIDFDHQLLPDNITIPLLWLGLALNTTGLFTPLPDAIWGAIFGYLTLWGVYWLFKLATGKEGMGYGDFKLLAALGAWFGWQALPVIVLLSSLVGAVVGITLMMVLGRDKNVPIPFGPYLAAAGWIAAIWGDQLTQAYLTFSGLS